ncbi:MAG: hypothetical protein VYA34_05975 [Myxococcota bacterium]|nr:hypothetical protein [Myxococcota bacterium]
MAYTPSEQRWFPTFTGSIHARTPDKHGLASRFLKTTLIASDEGWFIRPIEP